MSARLIFLAAAALLLSACSLFSQTPNPAKRDQIRAAVPYGADPEAAAASLSSLGFACSIRKGNYMDENGKTRSADHFLYCEERPGPISFACLNRDQVTVLLHDDVVSGLEVVRGPSCERN